MPNAIFHVSAQEFAQIPGVPIVYWLSKPMLEAFTKGAKLEKVAKPSRGLRPLIIIASFVNGGKFRNPNRSLRLITQRTEKLRFAINGFPITKVANTANGMETKIM